MSTQMKRIQNKIAPKDKAKQDLKPKAPRDIMLLVLIGLTALILILAFPDLDLIGKGMYTFLFLGMVIVYINRHATFTEKTHKILIGVSMGFLVACIGMLLYSIYLQFFA